MRGHFLILAFFFALSSASTDSDGVVYLHLKKRSISPSRAFSHVSRPWARMALAAAPPHIRQSVSQPGSGLSYVPRIRRGGTVNGSLPFEELFGGVSTVGEYYVELLFGGQPVRVQVDTGSSTLAVPLRECFNCRPGDQRFDLRRARGTASGVRCDSAACQRNSCHRFPECRVCSASTRACCSREAPRECGFFLRYADGSAASGALVEADVTLGGFTAPILFGGILSETEDFEAGVVDGIFGMAYKSLACNPTCVTPLFDTLVETKKVRHDVFSMCIGENGGTLTLGGSNPDQYEGELQYVPMGKQRVKQFYDVDIKGLLVNGVKVPLPQFSSGIVDSGTTVLVVTVAAYRALKKHFQTHYCDVPGLCPHNKGKRGSSKVDGLLRAVREVKKQSSSNDVENDENTWFSPVNCMALSDEHLKMLPNITIRLEGGVELKIEPDVYMLKFESDSGAPWAKPIVYRCLGLVPLEGLEHFSNDVIIGDSVLQRYMFTIDREKNRVGFARSKNCVMPNHILAQLEPPKVALQSPGWAGVALFVVPSALVGLIIVKLLLSRFKRQGYTEISSS